MTLCAATSINREATLRALVRCLDLATFGDAILFSDSEPRELDSRLRHVQVAPMRDAADYSRFMLKGLGREIHTSHCLVVQWDGFILDPEAWTPRFLEHDYIGAVWPQFHDHRVGNGGFSLRSRRLLLVLANLAIDEVHPEDLAICRDNRDQLEQLHDIRFADPTTAARFSYEREHDVQPSFGFHGVFNMPAAIGVDAFWDVYTTLDHKGPAFHDFWPLLGQLTRQPGGLARAARFAADYIAYRLRLG
ncbi:hypothetical protein H7F49_07510 [Novosphingobium flavum]|uniref:DUF5672 domain-containing protein n=1 Tax=Novosphingobium aerophilum TaxID=2839843 RepID=A0A7X1KBR1_9SPHN|nr:hypothetical protein [Novosphingobium aerophilum]